MGKNHDIIEFFGKIRITTEKAWLFYDNDSEKEVWVPKSLGEWDEAEGVMQMPEWIALDKELI